MKRDARLREGLVYALHRQAKTEPPELPMKLAGEILDEWDKMVASNATLTKAWYAARDERDRLQALLSEHHNLSALEQIDRAALIGERCPICKPSQ